MKGIVFLLISIFIHFSLFAQDTSHIYKRDSTVIKDTISGDFNAVYVIPDSSVERMLDTLDNLTDNTRQNTDVIHGLLQGKEIDSKTKYELIKNNLTSAARTYYLLNKGITDLKSRTTTGSLDLFITSLNNPESKELGFSFDDRVINMVKNIVLEGKANRNKRNRRIVEATNSIIKSPVFKSLTSVSPPLGIANSIMTFFHSASIDNKKIKTKNLKKFEQQLNKYVGYYTALNEGNKKFEYGLDFNNDQLNKLHKNLFYSLQFTGPALGFKSPAMSGERSIGAALNKYFAGFKKDQVKDFFADIEEKYSVHAKDNNPDVNYEQLLRENMRLKEANNQLESLVLQTKNFENLYDSYFELLDNYCNNVTAALNIAADYGLADKEIVREKQKELDNLKNETVVDIKASINIKELQNNIDNIKYRYKIF